MSDKKLYNITLENQDIILDFSISLYYKLV